jgi:anti-anti-sigma factor
LLHSDSPSPVFELIERDIWPGCHEIDVAGELDRAVCEQLRAALDRAAALRLHVLVDLSRCEFIDAGGVATLVRGHEKMSARGCQLLLFGVGGQVRRLLAATALAGVNHGVLASSEWEHPLAALAA